MERWMQWYTDALPWSQMAVGIAVAGLAWALVAYVLRASVSVAEAIARRTSTQLDDELVGRIRRPAALAGPVFGAHAFGWFLDVSSIQTASSVVETMLLTYIIVATFEILVVEAWLESRQGLKVPGPVRQLVIGLIWGAVLLGIAGEMVGFDLTPLLATGSVTSLVLGLALQQPLSNLFAGIVLHVERQPSVGDWLMVDGREGEVIEIGWRSTRLRTFSRELLVVPNLSLLNAQVLNFTAHDRECGRRVSVPVPFDVPPHVFDRWCRDALGRIDGVVGAEEPRTKTWLVSIDDHCQQYVVRFWAKEFRIHDDLESEFLKHLWYAFAEHGVQFPSRYQSIKVVDGPPPALAALTAARPPSFPPALPRPVGTGAPTPPPERPPDAPRTP